MVGCINIRGPGHASTTPSDTVIRVAVSRKLNEK